MNWDAALVFVGVLEIVALVVMGILQIRSERRNAAMQRAVEQSRRESDLRMAELVEKSAKIDKLAETLARKNDETIDQKFRILAAEMQRPVDKMGAVLDGIVERLAEGNATFTRLAEKAQEIELGASAIKLWSEQRFATKHDLTALHQSLTDMSMALQRCQASHHPSQLRTV